MRLARYIAYKILEACSDNRDCIISALAELLEYYSPATIDSVIDELLQLSKATCQDSK